MNPPMPIYSKTIPRSDLTPAQVLEMFQLLAEHFDGVTQEEFSRDLMEKNRVILLLRDKRLVGFSTLLAYAATFEGETLNVIFSGDTIVAPEAWGTTTLPRAWIAAVNEWREQLPEGRCFWLLLTSGFRTYRFLPVFWREFFPRFDKPTPPQTQRLLQQLAREQFGVQFDSSAGVVRFNSPQKLRACLQEIPTGREHDPHIAFFLANNPGHVCGEELVCLTELCDANLTRAGRRMIEPRHHESLCGHC